MADEKILPRDLVENPEPPTESLAILDDGTNVFATSIDDIVQRTGVVRSVRAGVGVEVDNTDPRNPIVSAPGSAGDMSSDVYDPQGISNDAFNRANHTGTQSASSITGLATVATTGNYNDLTEKPEATYWTDTYAEAEEGLSGYSEGDVIGVFADETKSGSQVWYRVEGGALVEKLDTSPATAEEAEAGEINDKSMSPLRTREAIIAYGGPVFYVGEPSGVDDTEAIQAVIDAAKAVEGVVKLGYGTYYATQLTGLRTVTLEGAAPHVGNQDQGGPTNLVALDAETDLLVADTSVQPFGVKLKNIAFFGAENSTANGFYCDTSTYNPFNFVTEDCAFIGFAVGYYCENGFYNKHVRAHFWNNTIAGHYGWANVSNEYINCNVGLVPENAIGVWDLSRKGTIINSSTSAENSGEGSILWRVGRDNDSTEIAGGVIAANPSFIGCHFEGTKACFVDIRAGSTATFDAPHFITSSNPLPAAVLCQYLDDMLTINMPNFATKGGGSYTAHVAVDSRQKGSGKLIITPESMSDLPVVTGISRGDGYYCNVGPVVVMARVPSGGQVIPHNTETTVLFATEQVDTDNTHNTTTGEITVKYPGIYTISGVLTYGSAVADALYQVRLLVNGTLTARSAQQSSYSADMTVPFSFTFTADPGDVVKLAAQHTGGVDLTLVQGVSSAMACSKL